LGKKHPRKLKKYETNILLSFGPKPGDTVRLVRDHPHISKDNNYWHIDVLFFEYIRDDYFKFLYKEHVPCDPPTKSN